MSNVRAELGHGLEEGLYLAVGFAFLGWQRAQVRRRELAGSPLPAQLAALAGSFAEPALGPLREILGRAGTRSGR